MRHVMLLNFKQKVGIGDLSLKMRGCLSARPLVNLSILFTASNKVSNSAYMLVVSFLLHRVKHVDIYILHYIGHE